MLIGRGITYVVKSWRVNPRAVEGGEYVNIRGRAPGFVSWLLSLFGIEATITFRVTGSAIHYEQGSLMGNIRRTIPLSRVSSSYQGYTKPWTAILVGAVLAPVTLGISLIIGIIYYWLNKALSVGIAEIGGVLSGIQFKASVIEGVTVDEAASRQVHDILEALIQQHAR